MPISMLIVTFEIPFPFRLRMCARMDSVEIRPAGVAPCRPWSDGIADAAFANSWPTKTDVFYSPRMAQAVIEKWREEYNTRLAHA